MSRTRSLSRSHKETWNKSTYKMTHHIYYQSYSYTSSNSWSMNQEVFDQTSSIVDDVKRRNVAINKHRRWLNPLHACDHQGVKMVWETKPVPLQIGTLDPGWIETMSTINYPSPLALLAMEKSGISPSWNPKAYTDIRGSQGLVGDVDWVALINTYSEACESLIPQSFFAGEFTSEAAFPLLRTIFQFAHNPPLATINTIHRLAKWLGRRNYYRNAVLGELKGIVKKAADVNLSWQFAVKPMISDVRSILDAHSKVEERLRFLESNRGTFVPIRVTQKHSSVYDDGGQPTRPSTTISHWLACRGYERKGTISGYGKLRPDITVQPRWAAYMEYFGLNKIVGTAWELIPFSFVLDWFSNAQEQLNELTRIRISSPYTEVRNMIYSEKLSEVHDLFMYLPYSMLGGDVVSHSSPVKVGTLTDFHYNRTLVCPGAIGFWGFPPLSLGKKISLGSLVIQKIL